MKVILLAKSNQLTKDFYDLIQNDEIDPNCYSINNEYSLLSEFAGRICYNSGFKNKKNRNSYEYHKHILESRHLSIYGHINFSFRLNEYNFHYFNKFLKEFLFKHNRIYYVVKNEKIYFNLSLRHIIEILLNQNYNLYNLIVLNIIIQTNSKLKQFLELYFDLSKFNSNLNEVIDYTNDQFEWYTFYIETNRRIANELIRHNTQYAVSQESTRYVDKSDFLMDFQNYYNVQYNDYYDYVNNFYKNNKNQLNHIDRKSKLGFLANFLPLGLQTKLVISFTKWQLEHIFNQRLTIYADKEIYNLISTIYKTIYPD